MAQAEQPQSWSNLPTDLAGRILRCLPAHSDHVRFGAVCRDWNLSSAQHCLPPTLPWFVLPDGTFFSLPHSESFRFPDSAGYHSSCGKWLVFSQDNTCFLKNPFSGMTLTLPNLSCFFPIDEPVEIISGHDTLEREMPQEVLNMNSEMSICKVIVCSTLFVAAIVEIGPLHTVALCRPGDDSWLVSALGFNGLLIDMMLYKGKLHAIDEFMELLAIDVGEHNDTGKLCISRIEHLIDSPTLAITSKINTTSFVDQFLVESHGALLLVCRTIFATISRDRWWGIAMDPAGITFEVFKADLHSLEWVNVTSLGDDQALFVSKSYSQSVCMSPYKLKGNCIFILDDDDTFDWFWKDATSSFVVYDMSDENTYPPLPSGSFKGKKPPATWLFPQ